MDEQSDVRVAFRDVLDDPVEVHHHRPDPGLEQLEREIRGRQLSRDGHL
jgi:hypothetical protein